MPALRKRLKKPETWLVLYGLLAAAALADSFRAPADQFGAKCYVAAVQGYQRLLGPLSRRFIRCRFQPTCSHYSIAAVRKYGIRGGLSRTIRRINACRPSVPYGTLDPP